MEFLAVLCVMVLLTPGISYASNILAPDQSPPLSAGSDTQQSSSPNAAPPPASADQLPAPREAIHFAPYEPLKSIEGMSSAYIPLDSWIYPAVMRLYGLGYVDTVFLGIRPWTRLSVAHMLDQSADRITGGTSDEAIDIYTALEKDLQPDMRIPLDQKFGRGGLDSVYERVMGIGGTPLRDSFHLGQTDKRFWPPVCGRLQQLRRLERTRPLWHVLRLLPRRVAARAFVGRVFAQRGANAGADRWFRHLWRRSLTWQYDHPAGPGFFRQ